MIYRAVPASPLHVGPLIRGMDALVLKLAMSAGRPRAELRNYMARSFECGTGLIDDAPVAMWGLIGSPLATEAMVWLCMTEKARRHPLILVREVIAFLGRNLETLHAITAFVDADDARAMRFAQFMGFEAGERMRCPGGELIPVRVAR